LISTFRQQLIGVFDSKRAAVFPEYLVAVRARRDDGTNTAGKKMFSEASEESLEMGHSSKVVGRFGAAIQGNAQSGDVLLEFTE
jgi:hypothetical protein